MKTSLANEWLATFDVELEPGDVDKIREPSSFTVTVNLRAMAMLYRRARTTDSRRATAEYGAIVVDYHPPKGTP